MATLEQKMEEVKITDKSSEKKPQKKEKKKKEKTGSDNKSHPVEVILFSS